MVRTITGMERKNLKKGEEDMPTNILLIIYVLLAGIAVDKPGMFNVGFAVATLLILFVVRLTMISSLKK